MVHRESNQGMRNVCFTCDADVTATEAIKVFKSKDHVAALKRRPKIWENGEFLQLLRETTALQTWLLKIGTMKTINAASRKFREFMSKGNVNSTIKLLPNNMEGGVLSLNKKQLPY